MSSREEALRRILGAAAAGRLTEEQHRELLGHLEDSVEAKVAGGASEIDAVALSLEELGDLGKIARQFPGPKPAAATPDGAVIAEGTAYAALALTFVGFFGILGHFVVPKLAEVFRQTRVPLPALTAFYIAAGDLLASHPLPAAAGLLALGAAAWRFRRSRVPRAVGAWALVLAAALCLGLVAALFLPLLSLLQGMGGAR